MLDAHGRLAGGLLRLLRSEFNIAHRAEIIHQTADALSRLLTAGINRKNFDDEVYILKVIRKTFQVVHNNEKEQEEQEPENYSTLQGIFVPFSPEVFALTSKSERKKLNFPDLCKFITAQKTDIKCYNWSTTVGKPKTSISYKVNGVLLRVSPVDEASEEYVLVTPTPHKLHLCR